jgi:hypothetical protein
LITHVYVPEQSPFVVDELLPDELLPDELCPLGAPCEEDEPWELGSGSALFDACSVVFVAFSTEPGADSTLFDARSCDCEVGSQLRTASERLPLPPTQATTPLVRASAASPVMRSRKRSGRRRGNLD